MDNIYTVLDDIISIQEATDNARDEVYSKINDFAEKVAVMEQCGLNVMSEDPTMQQIIDNREQVITEYTNDGPKKINRKLIGMANWVLPPFKKLQTGLNNGTLTHHEIDNFGSSVLKLLFAPVVAYSEDRISTLKTSQGRINAGQLKALIKKAKKTGEFDNDEINVLEKCDGALEDWLRASKYDRSDRRFYDRFIAYTQDTRTLDRIKKATDDVVEAMEELKKLAESHFNGSVNDNSAKEENENAKEEE